MRFHLRLAAIAFAATAGMAAAAAQSTLTDTRLQLSPEQKEQIYKSLAITAQPNASRADVQLRIGASLPPGVKPLDIPPAAVAGVPAVGRYKYVTVGTNVVIVEPSSRQIVEILRK